MTEPTTDPRTDRHRQITRRLNSDEWMNRHFGIACHASDVAEAVLEVLDAAGLLADCRPTADDPMPVFVIKAKDLLATPAVHAYRDLCLAYGLHQQAAEVDKAHAEMVAWRSRNQDRLKLPDHPHVPVDPDTLTPEELVHAELTDDEDVR